MEKHPNPSLLNVFSHPDEPNVWGSGLGRVPNISFSLTARAGFDVQLKRRESSIKM